MSVDGFRRPTRSQRPTARVQPASFNAPLTPAQHLLSVLLRPINYLRAQFGGPINVLIHTITHNMSILKHRNRANRKNKIERTRRMNVVAVAVFALTFFLSLFSFLLTPPAANASIAIGDGLTIYALSGNTTPRFKNYSESTDSFDTEQTTASNAVATSFVMKTSPIMTEAIAVYKISPSTLQAMCYDGTSWSNEWTATTTNQTNIRPFELEYEKISGNVVVLYATGSTGSNELATRTKSGTKGCGGGNWSSATNISPARTSGSVDWVEMQSDPNTNTLAAIWGDSNRDLSAMTWNGTSWGNEPSAALTTTLDTVSSTTYQDVEAFDLAFESVSGNLMIAWGLNGTGTNHIQYKRCTGGGASCTWQATANVPTVSDSGTSLDMSANPQTNEIVFGAIEAGSSDLSLGYWSGSTWTGTQNADTSCEGPTQGNKLVTANWMINGATTRSIVMYADSNSQAIDYFTGNAGTFTKATDFTPTPLPTTTTRYYKSRKDPFHLNRVMLMFTDSGNKLYAKHVVMSSTGTLTWSDSDGGASVSSTNISASTGGPFSFAYWQNVPVPGPPKLNQDGYIWQNDDQVPVVGNTADGDSVQAVGSTPITNVRQGERLTVRFHIRNTGVDPLSGSLGLFYDRGDGYFHKVDGHALPDTAAGNCTDTKYNCGVVDNTAGTDTGQYASMAFDLSGRPWVSYYDATGQSLVVGKYVGYGGTGCGTSGSSAWQCTVIDKNTATNLGQHTSLGFDGAGTPWVSYYDATNTDLKVAHYHTDTTTAGTGCGTGGSTTWDCLTVDNTANTTGSFSSIAFDQTGNAWVSYSYDNGTLKGNKYATYVASGGTGCGATATFNCAVLDEGNATGIDYSSIAFDHAGKPWIAYYDKASTELNVANFVGGSNGTGCGATGSVAFTCTSVDNTGTDTGSYPSLLFGPTGNAWVSYYDATSSALRVATNGGGFGTACTGSGWTCGQVDNTGTDTGRYTSLAADASGQIAVSYTDTTNTSLRIARLVGSGGNCTSAAWNCSAVDNTGTSTGQFTSVATAPDGNLWAAYYDPTNTSLRTAQVTGGGEILPAAGIAGVSPAGITKSQADMTAVNDTTNQNDADCLTAGAQWTNGVWGTGSQAQTNSTTGTTSILPAGNLVGQCTEVAFTLDTTQATAGATYRFMLASSTSDRNDKGVWRGPTTVAAYPTLTMDASPNLRFSKDTNPSFPTCDGDATWGCEAIQSTNSVGTYNSFAFDPAGRPWLSYYDSTNSALRYAKYSGSGGTGCANTQWTCAAMETTNTKGQHSSLAFAGDGTPWVAFRDNTAGTLRVAQEVSASGSCLSTGGTALWNCSAIDNGSTGQYTSIAFSKSDVPWIAYYDNTNFRLRMAQYVGLNGTGCGLSTAWTCTTVDATVTAGQFSNLSFDSSGTPWISYYDSANGQLRVAQYVGAGGSGCTSSLWQCTSVDAAGASSTSMSMDTNGKPWITYYDGTNTALDVAKYVGTGGNCSLSAAWQCTQVDNSASDGQYSSIAFDATGNPWISYYDSSAGDLRVAHFVTSGGNCTSTAWNCGSINTGGTVGQYTTIAFDYSGMPWVSYYDASNLDLKIAKLKIPSVKPSAIETTPAGPRNARINAARYHLDFGLAPRNSTADCSSVANDMGYCGVQSNDGFYDTLYGNANEQPYYLFNIKQTDNTTPANVQWTGGSTVSAATANIKLEVFHLTTSSWETISTNTDCLANSGCRISGQPANGLSEYYDSDGAGAYWMYFRVSQAASASAPTFQTNAFIYAPTTDLLLRHGAWFDPKTGKEQNYFWAQ